MALTEERSIFEVRILVSGEVQLFEQDIFLRDGVICGHGEMQGRIIKPGDDLTSEQPWVRRQAEAAHTAECITAYRAALELGQMMSATKHLEHAINASPNDKALQVQLTALQAAVRTKEGEAATAAMAFAASKREIASPAKR